MSEITLLSTFFIHIYCNRFLSLSVLFSQGVLSKTVVSPSDQMLTKGPTERHHSENARMTVKHCKNKELRHTEPQASSVTNALTTLRRPPCVIRAGSHALTNGIYAFDSLFSSLSSTNDFIHGSFVSYLQTRLHQSRREVYTHSIV